MKIIITSNLFGFCAFGKLIRFKGKVLFSEILHKTLICVAHKKLQYVKL